MAPSASSSSVVSQRSEGLPQRSSPLTFSAKRSPARLRVGSTAAAKVIPFIAAALLLGFYGVGEAQNNILTGVTRPIDDNTDVGAHFAGFLCGILVGALAAKRFADHPIGGRGRNALGWVSAGLVVAAWTLAVLVRG